MKTQSGIVAVRGTAAATFLCALLLTGCISVKGPEEPDPGTGEDAIEYWTEQAREWGAGEEQIQVLENAAAAGVVTSADVDQVTQALYQCYENAGLEYSGRMEEATTGSDVWFPAAQVVVPEELGEDPSGKLTEMMNACEDEHSIWLVSAYINQPSSRAKMDAVWTTDATRACLEQHGSTIPADATIDELKLLDNGECVPNSM